MLVASEIQQRYRISYRDALIVHVTFHDPAQVGQCVSAHLGEFQMRDKRLEVFIGKQQRQATLNAERGNIVRAELLWGARNSRRVDENLERVRLFAEPLKSLPFEDDCAECYGAIRADLARRGTPRAPNDMLIAAIALAHQATLVTRNQREFERVPGLQIEVWEHAP